MVEQDPRRPSRSGGPALSGHSGAAVLALEDAGIDRSVRDGHGEQPQVLGLRTSRRLDGLGQLLPVLLGGLLHRLVVMDEVLAVAVRQHDLVVWHGLSFVVLTGCGSMDVTAHW